MLAVNMNISNIILIALPAILTMCPFNNAYKIDVDRDLFDNLMDDYIVKLLKAEDVQERINKENISYLIYNNDDVFNELVSSITKAFLLKQKALKNLRDVVMRVGKAPRQIAPECCKDFDKAFDERFKLEVNLANHCEEFPAYPNTTGSPFFLPQVFTAVAKDNLKNTPFIRWQYFGAEDGYSSVYPSYSEDGECKWYDPRTRPWYLQTVNSIRKEVVFVVDSSGSMGNYHLGVTLLNLATEAVTIMIGTLTRLDTFAVVGVSDNYQTLSNFTQNVTCFDEVLAVVTERNVKEISTFLNLLEARGGTFYEDAMDAGFRYFNYLNSSSGQNNTTPSERIIIFLSDGAPNDMEEDIFENIEQHLADTQDSVRIVTMGIGNGDFELLAKISMRNNVLMDIDGGNFVKLDRMDTIESTMPFFFKSFEKPIPTDIPIWTNPYRDLSLQGQVVTASLPVFNGKKLIGVVGMDVILGDIISEVDFSRYNPLSYYFLLNDQSEVVLHPFLSESHSNRLFVESMVYERDIQFLDVVSSLSRGENGSQSFLSPYYQIRGGTTFYGTNETFLNTTYYWKKFTAIRYSVVFVGIGKYASRLNETIAEKDSLLYARFSIIKPEKPCWHAFTIASIEKSSIYLPYTAFHDHAMGLLQNWNASTLEDLLDFLEGKHNRNVTGVLESYRADVVVTNYAQKAWLHRDEENDDILGDILWRHLTTINGVFTVYPATSVPSGYDILASGWYRQIIAQQTYRYVLSAPYYDTATGALIMTTGRTFRKPRYENDPNPGLYGVMAADILLSRFNKLFIETYPICKETHIYRCYLIDTGGFLIVVSHWDRKKWFETDYRGRQHFNKHITEIEPKISATLIEKGIMTVQQCSNVGLGSRSRSYEILKQDFAGDVHIAFFDAFSFRLINLENANALILVRTYPTVDCHPGQFICPCHTQMCSAPEDDINNCQCPCVDLNPHYMFCYNTYANGSFYDDPPCIPTEIKITDAIPKDIEAVSPPAGLEICYLLNLIIEQHIEDDSGLVISCCVTFSIGIIIMFVVYLYRLEAKAHLRDALANKHARNRWGSATSLDETIRRQLQLTKDEMAAYRKAIGLPQSNMTTNLTYDSKTFAKEEMIQPSQAESSTLSKLRKLFTGRSLIQRIKRNVKNYRTLGFGSESSLASSRDVYATTVRNVTDQDGFVTALSPKTSYTSSDKLSPLPTSTASEESSTGSGNEGESLLRGQKNTAKTPKPANYDEDQFY